MLCEWLPHSIINFKFSNINAKSRTEKTMRLFDKKKPGETDFSFHNALRMATLGIYRKSCTAYAIQLFKKVQKKTWRNRLSHTIAHAVP